MSDGIDIRPEPDIGTIEVPDMEKWGIFSIVSEGKTILAIYPDGRVEGEMENMGEAARLFVEELKRIINANNTMRP